MRRSILLFVGGSFLLMLAGTAAAMLTILLPSYEELEKRLVERDVERVRLAIAAEIDDLARTATDYATWTEMYDFVRYRTPGFAAVNLALDSLPYLRLDAILVLDRRRGSVFLDSSDRGPADLGAQVRGWLAAHPGFAPLPPGTGQGLVEVPGAILVAVARPIVNSEETLPPDGILAMARILDAKALSARVAVSIQLVPPATPLPSDAAVAASRMAPGSAASIDTSSPSTITAWDMMADATGTPAVLVRVDEPRDVRAQGTRTAAFFFLSLFFIGAVFTIAMLLAFQRIVLSPLSRLSSDVLGIGTDSGPGRRLVVRGRGQIASLGTAINRMLDALERSTEQLRASERRTMAYLDAVPDAIFRVKRDGTITDARSPGRLPLLETAHDLVGRDPELILPLYSFLSPELFHRSIAATAAALDSGAPQVLAFHVDTANGRRWYEQRFVAAGPEEAIVLVREVTALKKAEEARRQEILLKEIHHRVKNNLQVISSLLTLQARSAGDSRAQGLLAESRDRVRSMALLHEKLYLTGDDRRLSFASYVRDLSAHLRHSYAGNSEWVHVALDVEEVELDLDLSVPCGLIITELLSNALKHGFPGGRRGTVTVSLHRVDPARLCLSVSDDGVGLPPGLDARTATTLGLRIVTMLVDQIRGSVATGSGPGASFQVVFPA